jgi:hypothetical protein
MNFPVLFAKNVLAYGSYWGVWGITYLFRLTGLPDFGRLSFLDLEPVQNIIITVLKVIIVGAAVWIAWRHRHARSRAFVESLAYTWLVFFVFAPGVCPQYLIWLAPFILIFSPMLYTCVLVALAMDESKQHWAAWSLLPWIVIVGGSLALWRKTANGKLDLRLFRFTKLRAENA